jgi:hypothetical protein
MLLEALSQESLGASLALLRRLCLTARVRANHTGGQHGALLQHLLYTGMRHCCHRISHTALYSIESVIKNQIVNNYKLGPFSAG